MRHDLWRGNGIRLIVRKIFVGGALLVRFVRVTTIVLVSVLLMGAVIVGFVSETSSSDPFEGVRTVTIPAGSDFETIMDSLQSRGILGARWSFQYFARLTGWGSQIKAGHYEFASGVSNRNLMATLRAGLQVQVHVTIPPGANPELIATSAARNMAFEPEELLAALKSDSLARELGTDTAHLFAYMLPDTYYFYWTNEPEAVIRRIKEDADRILASAESSGGVIQSKDDVLVMASIVEWETNVVEEKARVAGVYMNRLRRNWPMQADPTVQVAVIDREGSKRRLQYRDYEIKHPYNTYLFTGLPPGPITNPSTSSIRASLSPEEHDYMYFVAKPEGGHAFNTSLVEHNRDAQDLRRHLRERRHANPAED